MDDDVEDVIRMLWPIIAFDIHKIDRFLHGYDILAKHSRDRGWRRRIPKATRKMAGNQDKV